MITDLKEILNTPDDRERRLLLIKRGWELQRNESRSQDERAFCDWMLERADGPDSK